MSKEYLPHLGEPLLPSDILTQIGMEFGLPTHFSAEQRASGVYAIKWLRVENPHGTGDLIVRRMRSLMVHMEGELDIEPAEAGKDAG